MQPDTVANSQESKSTFLVAYTQSPFSARVGSTEPVIVLTPRVRCSNSSAPSSLVFLRPQRCPSGGSIPLFSLLFKRSFLYQSVGTHREVRPRIGVRELDMRATVILNVPTKSLNA
jgi:hypothetical protein